MSERGRDEALRLLGLMPERFRSKVAVGDGCWLWTGARGGVDRQQGQIWWKGRLQRATRALWDGVHGPIPPGLHVCHRCDNPRCVRPDHLFLGTHRDNMRDMAQKGRDGAHTKPEACIHRGERHHAAKLTFEVATEIRRLRRAGALQQELADAYGVSRGAIGYVVRGQRWTND